MGETNEQTARGNTTYVDSSGERRKGVAEKPDDATLTYWQQLEKYYDDIYRGQVEENNAYAAAATERTLSEIRDQIRSLNREYGLSNQQLYRDYMDSRKNLSQQLAAAGYTGGASESSRVRLESNYQENLGSSERSRLAGIAALDARGVQAEQEELAAARKANSAAEREYYSSLAALRKQERQEELAEQDWQRQEAAALRQRQWTLEDAAARQQQSDLRERASQLAAAGDFSGYAELGYTADDIALLRAAWESANPEAALGIQARSGGYKASDVADMPAAQAQRYLNALGYVLKVNGKWDYATESAFREVFGRGSGRYKSGGNYSYTEAQNKAASDSKSKSAPDFRQSKGLLKLL